MERSGQILDELTEVYALVGNIVEDGLVAVALIFYIAYLHLQSQILGYLATLNHRGMLPGLGFLVFLHVHLTRYAVDALDVVGTLQVGFLQLQIHQPSGQRHHADVMTRVGFYGHDVALLQIQFVDVMVVAFAGVLELHFHEVGSVHVARHVGQPVVGVQLTVLTAHSLLAESTVATSSYFVFFFHIILYFSLFTFHLFLYQ